MTPSVSRISFQNEGSHEGFPLKVEVSREEFLSKWKSVCRIPFKNKKVFRDDFLQNEGSHEGFPSTMEVSRQEFLSKVKVFREDSLSK